jgi:hypothetical protein
MSRDWVYENLFGLSPDQYNKEKDLMVQDAMQNFRVSQIENEGNDPSESGESYGTPHDLATLYGKGRMYSDPGGVPKPEKYANDKNPLGRPQEKVSKRNTQDDNFGKDRLGAKGMKKDYNDTSKNPMALENNSQYLKHQSMLNNIPTEGKKLFFEQKSQESSLLDESNIKEQ